MHNTGWPLWWGVTLPGDVVDKERSGCTSVVASGHRPEGMTDRPCFLVNHSIGPGQVGRSLQRGAAPQVEEVLASACGPNVLSSLWAPSSGKPSSLSATCGCPVPLAPSFPRKAQDGSSLDSCCRPACTLPHGTSFTACSTRTGLLSTSHSQ